MSEIGWSKAPEGATHYSPYFTCPWIKAISGSVLFYEKGRWCANALTGFPESVLLVAFARPTKEQPMDIERLRNDPAYWDEVAPEGATHYHPTGRDFSWYKRGDRRWEAWDVDGFWLEGTGSDKFFDSLIPRPSQPQWRGPEDGLPPVGTVCEVIPVQRGDGGGWCPGKVVHITAKGVALYEDQWGDFGHSMVPDSFRPLKSGKERAVEAALAQDCEPQEGMLSRHDFCARLYDAGLLKLPEDTQ